MVAEEGASGLTRFLSRLYTRKGKGLAAVAMLLILMRSGLPWLVEDLLESEGRARLEGEVTIDDVDLWLVRGAIEVEGFTLWPEGAAPTDGEPAGAPPRVSWQRLYTNISWLNLLSRIARIEDFELDGLEVSVARRPDGSLDLPRLREVLVEAEEEAEEVSEPFVVVIDRAAVRGARLRARDDLPGTPMQREIALPTIEVVDFSIGDPGSEDPGQLAARLDFEDGTISVEAQIREDDGRFVLATTLDVQRLPMVQLHVHDPRFAWTRSDGRLDGNLRIEIDTEDGVKVSGQGSVSDLRIEVPAEVGPALAWRRLELDIEEIDVARQTASIARITLDGGEVLLRPLEDPPSPLLPRPSVAANPSEPIPTTPDPPAELAESPAPPWRVRIGSLKVTDTAASVYLEQGPVDAQIGRLLVANVETTPPAWRLGPLTLANTSIGLGLDTGALLLEVLELETDAASSDAKEAIRLKTRLREDSTRIDARVTMIRNPLDIQASLTIDDARLGRYADLSGVSPVRIPGGSLHATLEIEAREDTLTLAGPITVDELLVLGPDGDEEDFSVAWDELFVDVESLKTAPGTSNPGLDLDISDLRLVRPHIQATRQEGVHLIPTAVSSDGGQSLEQATPGAEAPEPLAARAGEDEGDPTPLSPAESTVDTAGPALRVAVDRLQIQGGSARFVDRVIRPNYRGEMGDLEFSVAGLEISQRDGTPSLAFGDLSLDLIAPGDAPIAARARSAGERVQIDASLTRLPLSPFNPYVLDAADYSILEGEASLETTLQWAGDTYDSDTELTFSNLDVGNDRGGTLFEDTFGITITAALALMRDVDGDIGLTIPIEGSLAEGSEIGIGSIVGQALTRAILGAIVSPLKMLGAVSTLGDKVTDITPAPIEFLPGRSELTPSGEEKSGAIGRVLTATPWVRLGLTGRTQAADIRGLQEIDVLADLGQDQGILGSLRNLASGGTRDAIRRALRAGDTTTLSPDDRNALDELVAEKSVDDAQLRALARDRAEFLRTYLVEEYGAQPDQIEIADPLPSRTEGGSDVQVALIGRR